MNEQPGFRKKTPERLQAHVEAYADRGVEKFSKDQELLLKYSAELAHVTDADNVPEGTSQEVIDLIAKHKNAFKYFLIKEQRLETDFVEKNIALYNEKFKPIVAELKSKMLAEDPKTLPEYLGSGSNGSAFRISVEGREYAAKFSQSLKQSNFEIKPLIRAQGILNVAQLAAYSFEDAVVVMELLPGKDITSKTFDRPSEFPQEHIVQLIETIRDLDANGIVIDPKPSNFMYDPQQGFSLLDFHLRSHDEYRLPDQIMSLKSSLGLNSSNVYDDLSFSDPEYLQKVEARAVDHYKIVLPKIITFLELLHDRYPEMLEEWHTAREEKRKNPNIRLSEFVDRKYIPEHPDLKPMLDRLAELSV